MSAIGEAAAAVREVHRPHDTTIQYTVNGPADGPTLVFVHGWGCDRHDFDAVTQHVSQRYRVTLFAVRSLIRPEAIERYRDRIDIVLVDLGSHHFHVESPGGTAELLMQATQPSLDR